MKQGMIALMVGLLFIGATAFAADGDLIVDGKVGVGTETPADKVEVYENTANPVEISIENSEGEVSIGADAGQIRFYDDGAAIAKLYENGTTSVPFMLGIGDTRRASLMLYGDGTGSTAGGTLTFYTAADHDTTTDYFQAYPYQDRLLWTCSNLGQVMALHGETGYLRVGVGGGVATENLHVYENTANPVEIELENSEGAAGIGADNGTLSFYDDGTFVGQIYAGTSSDVFSVGQNDTVRGVLTLQGHTTGETTGGWINLSMSADYDGTHNYWSVSVNQDDLRIGREASGEVARFTAEGDLDMEGDIDLDQNSIIYDPSPTTNLTWNGQIASHTAGESLAVANVCYLKSDGKFWKADADAEATTKGFLTVATGTITADASGVFLEDGYLRNDTWNFTVGAELYVSTTAGAITETKPSGSGDQVRVVGYAVSADVIRVKIGSTYVEVP